MVMNPTTLRRVYDNEYRTEGDELTLSEVVTTVTDAVWEGESTSFRRNLQREHVGRLIDLSLMDSTSPSMRTISTLAKQELRRVMSEASQDDGDAYTQAHLADLRERIERAMEAAYVMPR